MEAAGSYSRFGSQGSKAQATDFNHSNWYPMDPVVSARHLQASLSSPFHQGDGINITSLDRAFGEEPDQISLGVSNSPIDVTSTAPLRDPFAPQCVDDSPEFVSDRSIGSIGHSQYGVLNCERKLLSVKMWRECFSGFAGVFAAHVLFNGAFECAAAAVCNLFIFILYAFAMIDKKAPTYFLCAASTSIYFLVVCLSLSFSVRGFEPLRENGIMKNAAACETVILGCAVAVCGVLGFKTMSLHRDLREQTLHQHAKRLCLSSVVKTPM